MAQSFGYAPYAAPTIAVIGSQFCVPYPIDIVMSKHANSLRGGNFVITDVSGRAMFKVKRNNFTLHNERVLVDAFDNPIVTLRGKVWTENYRWQVFRGESKEQSDLIFGSKTPRVLQYSRTNVNVYLANNINEQMCDFRIEGSWSDRTTTIYLGESSTIIAQMHMRLPAGSGIVLGRDRFMVTISPNVDYAMVVALIAIHEGASSGMSITSGVMFWMDP